MSTGKQYERKCVRNLRDLGVTAERVPRSVADAMPGKIDDVIVAPTDFRPADHKHRVITHRLQKIDDPERYMEIVNSLVKVEVKYTSTKAHGISTLLDMHKRTVGLGWPHIVEWGWTPDSDERPPMYSGGAKAFAKAVEQGTSALEYYADGTTPPESTMSLLDNADAAAIRASGEPWCFVWRSL